MYHYCWILIGPSLVWLYKFFWSWCLSTEDTCSFIKLMSVSTSFIHPFTLERVMTTKCVLIWQAVKTQMKCKKKRKYFIKNGAFIIVWTFCFKKKTIWIGRKKIWAVTWDFQQRDILTWIRLDEPCAAAASF